jgi:hypothetical protein
MHWGQNVKWRMLYDLSHDYWNILNKTCLAEYIRHAKTICYFKCKQVRGYSQFAQPSILPTHK